MSANRIAAIAVVVLHLAVTPAIRAQFTANYQTNIISGVTSNWSGSYYVGSNTFANSLLIQNGGVLISGTNGMFVPQPGDLGFLVFGNDCVGYSSSSNTAVVSGSGSVWSNRYALVIGRSGSGNSLIISNGGRVVTNPGNLYGIFVGSAFVGFHSNSSNSFVLITDTGSVWSVDGSLRVGYQGNGSLVISNGGEVVSDSGLFGFPTGATNSLIVTGAGSVWNNTSIIVVGTRNNINILDGGKVTSSTTIVAQSSSVLVSDTGSVWSSSGVFRLFSSNSVRVVNGGKWETDELWIGFGLATNSVVLGASGNLLLVAGGLVSATNLIVGTILTNATPDIAPAPLPCDNVLQLDSGSVTVTNAAGAATLEVLRGKLVLNGGTLQVDRFVMTNSCAQFVRTGGTLIYGTAVLDPTRDDDGDGIPNGWEQTYGLDPLDAADANVDSDGDGVSNLQEFLDGTDPTDSASALCVTTVMCPGDIVTNVAAGLSHAVVNYSAPIVSSNCRLVSTNCSPPSGSVFSVGTNTVTCTAVDTTSNNAGCSFTVTVVPLDSDGDGVPDNLDSCPNTAPGAIVDAHGCSIDQLVPCSGPLSGGAWRNHGQYVSSVAKEANEFLAAGLITEEQKGEIVSQAARSHCGKRQNGARNVIATAAPGSPNGNDGPGSGQGSPDNKPIGP